MRVGFAGIAAALIATTSGITWHTAPAAPPSAAADIKPAAKAVPANGKSGVTHGTPALVEFYHSAFPFDGEIPEQGKPFLDVTDNGRRGHTSPRGGVLWNDVTYSDRRSLLFVPRTFDATKPAALILFFHGNLATLERDVQGRQGVPRQLALSHLNAVLVAPQMAFNALDSSAGAFWKPDFLDAYLDEAGHRLETASDGRVTAAEAAKLPVIIVAYSGGYLPTAFTLDAAKTQRRLAGVILLDALFGESEKIERWITRSRRDAFFVSAYSKASAPQNAALRAKLTGDGIASVDKGEALAPGVVEFIAAPTAVHNDFVTRAWITDPLAALLRRVALPER